MSDFDQPASDRLAFDRLPPASAIGYAALSDIYFRARPTDAPHWTCLRIAHERWRPGSLYRDQVPALTFMLVMGGGGSWRMRGGGGRLAPGLLLAYGDHDKIEIDARRGLEHRMLCLHPGPGARALKSHGIPTTGAWPLPSPARLGELLATMLAGVLGGEANRQEIANHSVGVALATIAGQLGLASDDGRAYRAFLAARAELATGPADAGAIAQAARVAGVSAAHLSRLFQRYASMGPQQWLRRQRISRASHLLLTTDLAIAEVAERIGYADAFALSKAFRAVAGLPPSEFRRRERGR